MLSSQSWQGKLCFHFFFFINRWSGPTLLSCEIGSAETHLIYLQDRQGGLACIVNVGQELGIIVVLDVFKQCFSLFEFSDRQLKYCLSCRYF
jgi:hypothetical protein